MSNIQKDDWIYVAHMLDMCNQAQDLVGRKTREEYDLDLALRLALAHLIQIIGEAAQHVKPEFRQIYSKIPWHEVIGMRHRIVHDYMNIDEDVIWQVVQKDLPQLSNELKNIIPEEYL